MTTARLLMAVAFGVIAMGYAKRVAHGEERPSVWGLFLRLVGSYGIGLFVGLLYD